MEFEQIAFLWLMIPIGLLWLFIAKKSNHIQDLFDPEVFKKISIGTQGLHSKTRLQLLLSAILLMLIALSQPVLKNTTIKIAKNLSNIVIAIDISTSMLATDVYPNRFEFIKNKLMGSIEVITNKRVALLGFASQPFLITPLTTDVQSIQFLLKNLKMGTTSLKGTNILSVLESANELLPNKTNKQIVLLTDGGEGNFQTEIEYANNENMDIWIYDISTTKGSIIKEQGTTIKDSNDNIVIVKSNPDLKELAEKTRGKYLKFSLKNDDLSTFINNISGKHTVEDSNITLTKQLFYYPLSIAILLVFMAFFSRPRKV